MAEIVTVSLTSLVASTGSVVQATITTNIGVFSASVGLPPPVNASDDILRDFTAVQANVESYLVGKNPVNLRQIDETIKRVEGLDQSISMVLSMACARAAARHRGMKLYTYLAEVAGTSPALPTPAVTVLSRAAGPMPDGSARSQEVALLPSTSSSFLGAVEVLLRASRNISKLATEANLPIVPNTDGCVRLKASLAETLKVFYSYFSCIHMLTKRFSSSSPAQ
jgi:enolase